MKLFYDLEPGITTLEDVVKYVRYQWRLLEIASLPDEAVEGIFEGPIVLYLRRHPPNGEYDPDSNYFEPYNQDLVNTHFSMLAMDWKLIEVELKILASSDVVGINSNKVTGNLNLSSNREYLVWTIGHVGINELAKGNY